MTDEEIKAIEKLKRSANYFVMPIYETKIVLNLIEKQQKENKKQEKLIEKLLNTHLYACDVNKNKECNKKNCYINGGECNATTDITKVKYINLDDYISKDEIRERIKHIPTNEKNEIRQYQCIAMRCILYELLGE